MTTRGTRTSGTSKAISPKVVKAPILPKVLPYPSFISLETTPVIKGLLAYVIKHYGNSGLSVLVYRQPKIDQVAVICGDWKGNSIDLVGSIEDPLVIAANKFIKDDVILFLRTMNYIKLEQAQFFLALDEQGNLTLIDIQIAIDKFTGPGLLRDVFSKIYRTQEIIKIEAIDERALEYIDKGIGSYSGDLIIKPSRFKIINDPKTNKFIPLYIEVRR